MFCHAMQEIAYNMHPPCDTGVSVFPATMILPSRKETYDSYTPSVSSSASMTGVLHHRSSKETIQSQEGSISNFSSHSATAAIDKDLFNVSRQGHLSNHSSNTSNGRDPSISDYKSSHSLEKPTFRFRNESLSTVCTISEPESDRSSTATSTPRHRFRSLSVSSLEDDAESSPPSTPRSSWAITPILITYPSPFLSPVNTVPPSSSLDDGDSQPLTTMETSTAVTSSIQEHKELLSNVNHHAAADHKDPVVLPRKALPPTNSHNNSKPSRSQDYKSDFSSPPAPSSRRASKVTVEYHKPWRRPIQEYQEPFSLHAAPATNYKDPFTPSRQASPPVSSHNASNTSRSQDHRSDFSSLPGPSSRRASKITVEYHKPSRQSSIQEYQELISNVDLLYKAQQEFSSSTLPSGKEMATPSVPPTPPGPSRANVINLTDLYNDPNPTLPTDRMGTESRSRSTTATAKSKKGMLGFMTDFLNSNKRPKISVPNDPVHLMHVGFNLSTGEFTGLPKEWQQLLQDSGISKSEQVKNPLAVMEIVKFYQEGGGDIWDWMGYAQAPGSSRSPPTSHPPASYRPAPSPPQPARPSLDWSTSRGPPTPADLAIKSQATVAVNVPVAERRAPQLPTAPQQQSTAVTSLAKTTGAIPRRREKKKEDKENDADIVKRLQQICTDANPTWLYRNLVKIGQG